MPQEAHNFDSGSSRLRYLLHLPESYRAEPERTWPLLLFLHGRGERGDDLERVKQHGISKVAEATPDFPFVALSPQCPLDTDSWRPHNAALIELVDDILVRYAVDPSRVYLTGLSMGGRGAWLLATEYPERFAAIAPICGSTPRVPDFQDRLSALRDKPLWVFHGALDSVVPIDHSVQMVRRLRKMGSRVRFTVYPHTDHDSWSATYDDPQLYQWMLQCQLAPPAS